MIKIQIFLILSLAYVCFTYEHVSESKSTPDENLSFFEFLNKPPTVERTENPCTEEVLRSPEIQAFRDPLNRSSYVVCTEIDIFVRMPCATGTFFDETIRHCVPVGWTPPTCPVGLCQNQADCIIDEMKNEYKCLCRVGYTGLFCETNIDECAIEGNKECGVEGKCIDQLNGYYCDFGNNKIGVSKDQNKQIDIPCTLLDLSLNKQFFEVPSKTGNRFIQCTSESEFVLSKCADTLFWNQEKRTCTIEKPIMKTGACLSFPCENGGECIDMANNNFQCKCKSGYVGVLCEEVIDFCFDKPCNGGRCVSHLTGYNCVCEDKIIDQSCNFSGYKNPCVTPFDYQPNPIDSTKYFACGPDRLAFVKKCAPGTFWDQDELTCAKVKNFQKHPTHQKMSLFDHITASKHLNKVEAFNKANSINLNHKQFSFNKLKDIFRQN